PGTRHPPGRRRKPDLPSLPPRDARNREVAPSRPGHREAIIVSARGAPAVGPPSVPANDESDTPSGLRDLGRFVRLLAPLLAKELAPLLSDRDSVPGADVSPRPGKERETWASEVEGS